MCGVWKDTRKEGRDDSQGTDLYVYPHLLMFTFYRGQRAPPGRGRRSAALRWQAFTASWLKLDRC